MRLPEFIINNMETIIAGWEAFAATQLPAANQMTELELRNHSQQILEAVVKDLRSPRNRETEIRKSEGRAIAPSNAPETAAQTHAILRARSDFDIKQLVAEYRALRASVLRLWKEKHEPTIDDLDDIVRFNEAIDQALAESVDYFSAKVEQARNLLLSMIGHDMRNPLQAILLTAQHLAALDVGEDVSRASARLIGSGARMQALLDDLVVYNRHKLGLGFRIAPSEVDLRELVENELDQFRAAHPEILLELEVKGDTCGRWDAQRLHQLLGNLISNAHRHSLRGEPVRVVLDGSGDKVCIEVRNVGSGIEESMLQRIFDPLASASPRQNASDHSLGLGLFIAREITTGHGGDIEAYSEGRDTVFAVCLPRSFGNSSEES